MDDKTKMALASIADAMLALSESVTEIQERVTSLDRAQKAITAMQMALMDPGNRKARLFATEMFKKALNEEVANGKG